jgi:hypothetical protein
MLGSFWLWSNVVWEAIKIILKEHTATIYRMEVSQALSMEHKKVSTYPPPRE